MAKSNQENQTEKLNTDFETKVIIEFPSTLQIELVQANEVRNYEIFQWLATGSISAAIGFWTTFFLNNLLVKSGIFVSAALFSIASIVMIVFAIFYRKKTFAGSIKKEVNLSEFKRNLK